MPLIKFKPKGALEIAILTISLSVVPLELLCSVRDG